MDSLEGVITLSSDDESGNEPPKKKPKITLRLAENEEELVIVSDDENVANMKNGDKPADKEPEQKETKDDSQPPDAVVSNVADRFDVFVDLCLEKVEIPKHKQLLMEKTSSLKNLYEHATDYATTGEFQESLEHKIKLLQEQPKYALHCFNIVFQQLKRAWKSQKAGFSEESKSLHKLRKKLLKSLDLLHVKIRELETAELTIDDCDDEDSKYIQLQRYKERAVQLYKKLCEIDKEDADTNRIINMKLRFDKSKHECINKAIRRRYKNNDVFPTYYDIDKLIKKCVQRNKLELSNTELEIEIKQCFEALGNLLQKRRKQDLLDIHADFIACTEDPAEKDDSLQTILQVNQKQGEEKLSKLCTEFVIKQENGEDYTEEEEEPVDSGSDKSNNDSDSE